MPKVLVATEKPFAPKAVQEIRDILTEAGYELALLEKYTEKKDLLDAVADIDGLIIRSDIVDSSVLEAAKNLKIVVRAGAGYDNIDLVAATAKGVVAMNTPGQNSNAVAELALGMMIYIARGQFNGKAGTELKNKTLGIHAYGNVGKLVAKIAKGFGMQVFAFDPFVGSATIEADGVIAVNSQEELYSKCRYISLHIPVTGETKGSIDFELLSKMPDGAVLVNTARKEVVNEEGLKKMFAERKDFCYATDVAPDCADELVQYDTRYFATPKKMGAQTAEANINAGIAAAQQIIAYINKGDTSFQVNK